MKNILIIVLFASQLIAATNESFLSETKDTIKRAMSKLAPEKVDLSQSKLPKKLEKIYEKPDGTKMTEGEKIYAFSDIYIKKVPAAIRKKQLTITNAIEKEWTYENVYKILLNYGDIKNYKGREDTYKYIIEQPSRAIVKTAIEHNLPFPKTLDQFVYQLFDNISTNKTVAMDTISFANYLTYEPLADVYVDIMTNRWNKRIIYDHLSGFGDLYRNRCISTLGTYMGTPNTVSKLNRAIQTMVDAGKSGHVKPLHAILPDKYPLEAKEWLLYHPRSEVRRSLNGGWFKSKWPEKVEILKVHLRRTKKIHYSDQYFWGDKGDKRDLISEMEARIENSDKARNRWLEDEMRFGVNDSLYTYDDSWEGYCKDKQKTIKSREKSRFRIKKEIKAKPAKEVEAERQKIKKWQKEGIDSCTFEERL